MPFNLDPAIGARMAAMFGGGEAPHPLAAGDVNGRRERVEGFFKAAQAAMPEISDVATKDFHTPATDGHSLLLRWFTKKDAPSPGSAVVYAHGGGMISCNVELYDKIIKAHVSKTGVPFLAVDYRLAPEVNAPVPVTDVYAGLRYLHEHAAELGVDASRIAIMGDSAGGGITASLAHYVKLRGGPTVKKQILLYPMLDDRNTVEDPYIAPFALMSRDDNFTGWSALLGDRMGGPDVHVTEAPGRMTAQEARGLPPAYIDVGELDIFRTESLQYALNLGQAGVSCEFHLVPGAPHAFEGFGAESESVKSVISARERQLKSL